MAKIETVAIKGKKRAYDFDVYPADTTFREVGAIYIFARRIASAQGASYNLIYIGQTESLAQRIPQHEKWPCARRNNVNCICVHVEGSESSRLDIETDLRAAYNTPCNDQ